MKKSIIIALVIAVIATSGCGNTDRSIENTSSVAMDSVVKPDNKTVRYENLVSSSVSSVDIEELQESVVLNTEEQELTDSMSIKQEETSYDTQLKQMIADRFREYGVDEVVRYSNKEYLTSNHFMIRGRVDKSTLVVVGEVYTDTGEMIVYDGGADHSSEVIAIIGTDKLTCDTSVLESIFNKACIEGVAVIEETKGTVVYLSIDGVEYEVDTLNMEIISPVIGEEQEESTEITEEEIEDVEEVE